MTDNASAAPPAPGDTLAWLIDLILSYGEVDEAGLGAETRVSELGLDSLYVMMLSADIEEAFDIELDTSFLSHHETLADLARALDERVSGA